MARCAEDSIFAKKDKNIVKYCNELLQHKDFDRLCEEKNGNVIINGVQLKLDYRQYITDNRDAAQGRIDGKI